MGGGTATATAGTKIVPGSKVYIDKMGGFENYLAAAFAKKKVQLLVVADEEQASYDCIAGTSEDKKAGWAKIVFMGNIHSDNAASVTMTNKKTSAMVLARICRQQEEHHARRSDDRGSLRQASTGTYRRKGIDMWPGGYGIRVDDLWFPHIRNPRMCRAPGSLLLLPCCGIHQNQHSLPNPTSWYISR